MLAVSALIQLRGPVEAVRVTPSVALTATATVEPTITPTPVPAAPPVTLVGAGDIASCGSTGAARTAAVLEQIPGTIFTAGDNAYDFGTASEFETCFGPTWGRFRDRIRPAAGNHDYGTASASAYFEYFGGTAGERGRGYYSYDLGAWHVVVLNAECALIGGCGPSSPEVTWLRADLAASDAKCTVAIWHEPRWSSGLGHGSDPRSATFWSVLYASGAEIVVNGHDHDYERFAPQTPDGARDDARGIREFVVGTGGRSLYPVGAPIANSEVLRNDTFGVLALTLRSDGYDWRFIAVDGARVIDAGSDRCH